MFKWFLLWSVLCVGEQTSWGQIVSTSDGARYWDDPASWTTGIVPTSENSSEVVINHPLVVRTGYVSARTISVNALLTIESEGALAVYGLLRVDAGRIECFGTIHSNTGSSYQTTPQNTKFFDGSTFIHWQSAEGDLPLATWSPSSTYVIKGLDRCISFSSSKWGQALGNLVYECANQGPFMDWKGLLKEVQGDFLIKNTGGGVLILHSTVGAYNLHIGGSFIVEGASRVWMSETSRNANIKIDKNLVMNTSVTAASYLTTSGLMTVSVGGDVRLIGTTRLKFCSASNGVGKIFLAGDLFMSNNSIDALGPGTGEIHFSGIRNQKVKIDSRVLIDGNVSYYVHDESTLDLEENLLRMSTGGKLVVHGKVVLGSGNVEGALKGNIQFIDRVAMNPDATVEYRSEEPQWISLHPSWPGVNVSISSARVTQISSLQVGGDLLLNGDLHVQLNELVVAANVLAEGGSLVDCGRMIINGATPQTVDTDGALIAQIVVDKLNGDVTFVSPVHVTQSLSIRSQHTTVNSGGNLNLKSASAGTAAIGPIPAGSAIKGDVVVERFIPSIGSRKYRYLSSAVTNASVASMIDDFPVTGNFVGASTRDARPSLFRYEESAGGWSAFPKSGTAAASTLSPGTGYAAFMFDGQDISWDVTGELNQGTISLPVTYTELDDPFVGWNLVGNPYASPIAWGGAGGWSKSNIAAGIAVRSNSEGNFVYWDGEVGDLPDGIIAAGQAFWVRATAEEASLQISEMAKAGRDQTFFRLSTSSPDYVELQVSMGDNVDRAFIRLRSGAIPGNDSFDVQKFDNNTLTVALRGEDDMTFAIMATDRLPCQFEVPVVVKAVVSKATQLTFSAIPKGLLRASRLKLHDRRTNLTFNLLTDPMHISVDPGENIADRFALVVESDTSFNLLEMHAYDICNERAGSVNLTGLTPGIDFILRTTTDTLAHHQIDSVYQRVSIDASQLKVGVNELFLDLANACHASTSVAEMKVFKSVVAPPKVQADEICAHGTARLWTEQKFEPLNLLWYSSPTDTDHIAQGRDFTTPELTESIEYYASLRDSSGCESGRVAVPVIVRSVEALKLEWDGASLTTNYPAPISWYMDGALIVGSTGATLYPERSATYEAQVLIGKCLLKDLRFIDVSTKGLLSILTPNPVYDRMQVGKAAELINIFDTTGNSVLYLCSLECADNQPCSLDVSRLAAGIYLVRLRLGSTVQTIRIQKL